MKALQYEHLVRRAFGYKLGKEIQRNGDPYKVGDADYFNNNYLDKVKLGVKESFKIFNNDIKNNFDLDKNELALLQEFIKKTTHANNVNEISAIIDDYEDKIFNKYYKMKKGIISFR